VSYCSISLEGDWISKVTGIYRFSVCAGSCFCFFALLPLDAIRVFNYCLSYIAQKIHDEEHSNDPWRGTFVKSRRVGPNKS
jgi:hypothetical protein